MKNLILSNSEDKTSSDKESIDLEKTNIMPVRTRQPNIFYK